MGTAPMVLESMTCYIKRGDTCQAQCCLCTTHRAAASHQSGVQLIAVVSRQPTGGSGKVGLKCCDRSMKHLTALNVLNSALYREQVSFLLFSILDQ